jgi:hypothetical protein
MLPSNTQTLRTTKHLVNTASGDVTNNRSFRNAGKLPTD